MVKKGTTLTNDLFRPGKDNQTKDPAHSCYPLLMENIISRIKSLPTLPGVVNRVIEVTADPGASVADLFKIINADVAMTTVILKSANSALYSFPRGIGSLQQAIALLGFVEIRNIVMAKAVFSSFRNLERNEGIDLNLFWEHSLVCGLAASIISSSLDIKDNEAFACGLIHDIGKLVLFMCFPDEYAKMIRDSGLVSFGDHFTEREKFGISHEQVGKHLLKRWMFPHSLVEAVGNHHCREHEHHSRISMIVHVADLLAYLHKDAPLDETGKNPESARLESFFYHDIFTAASSLNISWNSAELNRFRVQLAQSVASEAEALQIFFS